MTASGCLVVFYQLLHFVRKWFQDKPFNQNNPAGFAHIPQHFLYVGEERYYVYLLKTEGQHLFTT